MSKEGVTLLLGQQEGQAQQRDSSVPGLTHTLSKCCDDNDNDGAHDVSAPL